MGEKNLKFNRNFLVCISHQIVPDLSHLLLSRLRHLQLIPDETNLMKIKMKENDDCVGTGL